MYELVAAKNGSKNLAKALDSDPPPGVLITVGGQDRTPLLGSAKGALIRDGRCVSFAAIFPL